MRVLIVKTSSMGDVLHALPAVSDAAHALPQIRFDWLVEEAFAGIPGWHPAVADVIPVALRRWRKRPWHASSVRQAYQTLRRIRRVDYDCVIDAQGLIKSAVLSRLSRGPRHGLHRASCRESVAAFAYQHPHRVAKGQHAILRTRKLFAAVLGYRFNPDNLDYGLQRQQFEPPNGLRLPYLVFLHGATWASKQWPVAYWRGLVGLAHDAGYTVYLPWGDRQERQRADSITAGVASARVLPHLGLAELAGILAHAAGVVAVDSGLGHLAAALDTPGISLYGATSTTLTGTLGFHQRCMRAEFVCSPCLKRVCTYTDPAPVSPACYQTLPPERVWEALMPMIRKGAA